MRVTKTMREVIVKRLTEKRQAANKTARADYDARRHACSDEIEAAVKGWQTEVEKILRRHRMDTEYIDYRGNHISCAEDLLRFNDSHIYNDAEDTRLRSAEDERYKVQQNAIENIIFDAEAGGDRDTLLAAIAAVHFE